MRMKVLSILPILLIPACGQRVPEGSSGQTTTPKPDPRDAWQKPEVVLEMMDPDLTGVVVADLFADTGYFTFKLIDAGANVIAVVNEPAKAELLTKKKQMRKLSDERLRIRTVPMGDPGLGKEEAEIALIVHRYHTIQDKKGYFELMRRGLKYPRPLFIVEWQDPAHPASPNPDGGPGPMSTMEELLQLGYSDIGAHSDKIPKQVVILATDYIELNLPEPEE
jgi:hypothetical protein